MTVKYGPKAWVYNFKVYDIINDELVISKRFGTKEAIDKIHGVGLGMTKEVPAEDVDSDGFTVKDYVLPEHR